jgi:predicted Fe-S protein YdhL (DUF1289 family)
MNPETGYCVGCLRTIEEIASWLELTNEEKLAVLRRVDERRNTNP